MDEKKKPSDKDRIMAHDPLADLDWGGDPPSPPELDNAKFLEDEDTFELFDMLAHEADSLWANEELAPPDEAETTNDLDNLIAQIDAEFDTIGGTDWMDDVVQPTAVSAQQYILFNLGHTEYGIPIYNVLEIGRPLSITAVPNVPNWVLGVANLRGDIISIIHLRSFLGLAQPDDGRDGRLLVTQTNNEESTVGLIVDRVNGIKVLTDQQIGTPTAPLDDQVATYLRGVCEPDGHLLVILNLEKLLLSPEMQQFETV